VDAASLQYAFDCGSGYGSWSSTNTATCATIDDGSRTVKGKIQDKDEGVTEYTDTVTINNVVPTGVSAGGPYNGIAGQPVSLSASATCASVDTCTFAWDLDNDGDYDDATGTTASYIWNTIGSYTIGVKVTDDDGSFATDSASVTISGAMHSIDLELGWNLVSFNLHPTSTAIEDVLATVFENYDLVYAWDATGAHSGSGNWLMYDPDIIFEQTLTDLDETMGFWIHMTVADRLDVIGSIPTSTNIGLSVNAGGWNLVGYPSAASLNLPGALRDHGVGTDFSLIYAFRAAATPQWLLFDRLADPYVNSLTAMAPGWGYWVKVSADNTWHVEYTSQ
jgi:hypothetical protein